MTRSSVEVLSSTDRWILKIVGSVTVAGILGGSALMMNMQKDIAVIQTEMKAMTFILGQASSKRYDSDMANADKANLGQTIEVIRSEIREANSDVDRIDRVQERYEERLDRLYEKVNKMNEK